MMRATHLLTCLLIGLLVIITPGGSTCLPLPHGRHLHVTWSDLDGHALPSPRVFTHAENQPQASPSRMAHPDSAVLGSGALTALTVINTTTPVVRSFTWLAPAVTLTWVSLPHFWEQRQPGPAPFRRPPRAA